MAAPSASMSARRVRSGSNIVVQGAVLASVSSRLKSRNRTNAVKLPLDRDNRPETSAPQPAFLQVYSTIKKKPWPKFRARTQSL